MRLLILSFGYPPTVSGVSLVAQKLSRAMARRGHQVVVVTSSETRERYETVDEGVRLIRLQAAPNPVWQEGPIALPSHRDFQELAERFQPELVHSHDSSLLALQARHLCRERDIPLLATCHYVPRFAARQLSRSREPIAAVESLLWMESIWFYNWHDHVVFATKTHRSEFLTAGLAAPTSIISNGIDIGRYCPRPAHDGEKAEIEARYHLPAAKRTLFVGRLAKDKEIDVLIEALARVRDRTDAHLIVVGRGDYRQELQDRIEVLGMQERCHLAGFVPEADMPALFRASDLFAIAATTEVQSLPVLQACATGLPIVAADAMALPELVHDGINGNLIAPGDTQAFGRAFASILGDPVRAREMGAASLAIAAPHDETRTFDAYERLYKEQIAARLANPGRVKATAGRAQ
jgi:glycosyltransferase involved in cell wall biosynthesis